MSRKRVSKSSPKRGMWSLLFYVNDEQNENFVCGNAKKRSVCRIEVKFFLKNNSLEGHNCNSAYFFTKKCNKITSILILFGEARFNPLILELQTKTILIEKNTFSTNSMIDETNYVRAIQVLFNGRSIKATNLIKK